MNINLEKWAIGICLVFLLALGFKTAKADCTGCGDDGHQVCPIEEKHKHITVMTEEHKTSSSTPLPRGTFNHFAKSANSFSSSTFFLGHER